LSCSKEEKLIPLGTAPKYRLTTRRERKVSFEGFVYIGGSRYSEVV
jgi:hypothetical protein